MAGLFGPRIINNILGGIRVQTSIYGSPLPIVGGRNRIAPNLIWYGDFFSKKLPGPGLSGSGGLSGPSAGQYDYGAAVILAICQGPITRIGNIWVNGGYLPVNLTQETYTVPPGGGSYTATQAVTFLQDMGVTATTAYSIPSDDFASPYGAITLTGNQQVPMTRGGGTGQYTESSGVYTFGPTLSGNPTPVEINYTYAPPITSGGVSQDPITTIGFTTFIGSAGQAPWGYMTTNHPTQALGYTDTAYVATPVLDLGVSGTVPNFNFEVYGLFPFGRGVFDCDPSVFIYNMLTDPIWGCGFETAFVDLLNTGPVVSVVLVSGGGSYAVGDWISIDSPGAGGYLEVTAIGGGGAITSAAIVGRGHGYPNNNDQPAPGTATTTTAATGFGSGATLYVVSSNYSDYCVANGLFMSPVCDQQRNASDYLGEFLEATNTELVESDGLMKFVSRGDTSAVANGQSFTPATSPVYDLDDTCFVRQGEKPPVQIERPSIQDAYNSVRVEYSNFFNNYNSEIVEAQDLGSLYLQEPLYGSYKYRPEPIRSYRFFTTQTPAALAAQTLLNRHVYIRNKYKFKLDPRFFLIDPMDIVTIPASLLYGSPDQTAVPVRITAVTEDKDRNLDYEAEDFPWGCSGPTLYGKQSALLSGPNPLAPPGSVNPPIIFEALSRLNNQVGHSIWFGCSGTNPNWGGCDIFVSLDGGANYSPYPIATVVGRNQMGVLTNILPVGTDPDTANTLSVNLAASLGALNSGTMLDADLNALLCYVDGELISYETATLTGPYNYDITYLRRGVFNSVDGAHAIGSNFLFFDNSVEGWNYDVGFIGTTVYFKFTSFNQAGQIEESLADVPAYPYTITGSGIGLLTPAHASYRPLSNPLTGHDLGGGLAEILVAPFSMRVPGMTDIPFGAGTLTTTDTSANIVNSTLYYVYFDDPGFIPLTAPAYKATLVKEDAMDAAGRFFIGSIFTPQAGGTDTSGNNDGGGGAQMGMLNILNMSLVQPNQPGTITGNASLTDPLNALDSDETTFTLLDLGAPSGIGNVVEYQVGGPPGITRKYTQVRLAVLYEVIANSVVPGPSLFIVDCAYGFQGPNFSWPFSLFTFGAGGGAVTKQWAYSPPFPVGTNLSQVSVIFTLQNRFPVSTSGTATLRVYDCILEAIE